MLCAHAKLHEPLGFVNSTILSGTLMRQAGRGQPSRTDLALASRDLLCVAFPNLNRPTDELIEALLEPADKNEDAP